MTKEGFIYWIERSSEWDTKAFEDIELLGHVCVVKDETDVWGDDWNDCPAQCNAGEPYDSESIPIYKGDKIIIVRRKRP